MAQVREGEAQRQAATLAKQEAAAGEAKSLWQGAGKADPEHGYLRLKGLPPFGIRQHCQGVAGAICYPCSTPAHHPHLPYRECGGGGVGLRVCNGSFRKDYSHGEF